MFENMYTEISGTFVRICSADQLHQPLIRNSSDRPEARYNRKGQDALYLAVNEESARVAMRKYAKDINEPLVLAKYKLEICQLVDLRHKNASELKTLASQDWQAAIKNGTEPTSWQVSDLLRQHNKIGLIDPSRKDPEKWHIVLFSWNEKGAPKIELINEPLPINLDI